MFACANSVRVLSTAFIVALLLASGVRGVWAAGTVQATVSSVSGAATNGTQVCVDSSSVAFLVTSYGDGSYDRDGSHADTMTGAYDVAPGKTNGAITGQVTVIGTPVANAMVSVKSSAGSESVAVSCGATGSHGGYSCENLATGTYDVRVSGVRGYANEVRYFVEVIDGRTTTDVSFAIQNGTATISGGVLDPDDEPLPGASVQAFSKENPGTWAATATDENGRYVVTNMRGGSYLITVDHPGLAEMTRNDVPVADSGTTVVNLPGDDGSATGGGGASCDAAASLSAPPATLLKGRIDPRGKVIIKLRRSGSGGFKFVVKGKGKGKGMVLLTGGSQTMTFGFVSGEFAAGGVATMKPRGRRFVYP